MKYTGILTTLSVMAAFTAFSSESMAAKGCELKNCPKKCLDSLNITAKDCDTVFEQAGDEAFATVNNCKEEVLEAVFKNKKGCRKCKLECNVNVEKKAAK